MAGDFAKGEAYQRQAKSDYEVAKRLAADRALSPCEARCHIAAMCQQAVEKSIKSLSIALGKEPKRTHQVYALAIDMTRITRPEKVKADLHRLFSHAAKEAINELSGLVPQSNQDDPTQSHRNNEYPFTNRDDWVAPCDDSIFTGSEIARYLRETGRILEGATRIRAVIHRVFKSIG